MATSLMVNSFDMFVGCVCCCAEGTVNDWGKLACEVEVADM